METPGDLYPSCNKLPLGDFIGGSSRASCDNGVLTLEAAQRERLINSRLQACKRKASQVALLGGFKPRIRQPVSFSFAISPLAFDPETAPNVDVLKLLHAHPRDFRIRFQASDHTYYIDGVQTKGSVTGMIHAFSQPFDADVVISKMMNGRNWPRAGYLKHEVSLTWMSRLCVHCPDLLHLYAGNPRDDGRISKALRDIACYHDISDELAQLTLPRDAIKAMWNAAGREAAHYGTYMHYLFEALLNGYSVPTVSPEVRMLQSFLRGVTGNSTAWRTEWTIFGDAEKIAGSIDFCMRLPDGSMMLVDWKRTSGLHGKYQAYQAMRPPISHIADCAGMHYRLQLNVYRHLLEKYYDIRVARMLVVCCHPEHYPKAFVDEVPRLEKETDDMLRVWCDVRGGSEANHNGAMADPRTDQLDVVFQVCRHDHERKDSIAMDYYGGKEVSDSAVDIVEMWHEIQMDGPRNMSVQDPTLQDLAQPQPMPVLVLPTQDELDSDSDDWFWNLRPDLCSRATSGPLDVSGGSFNTELLRYINQYVAFRRIVKHYCQVGTQCSHTVVV